MAYDQILSSIDTVVPMGLVLCPAMGGQSWRPAQGRGTLAPSTWDYIAAASALDSWIGLVTDSA